jgi:hypothetical protein
MKKLVSILAVAMLFVLATNAQAADSWPGESVTGTYNATVYCIPQLTPVTTSETLGTFFTGSSEVTITELKTVSWNLSGPPEAFYSVTYDPISPSEINGPDGSKLIGEWYFDGVLQTSNIVNVEGYGNTEQLPGTTGIGCDQNGSDAQLILFKATKIVPGSGLGTVSFEVTLTVSASI